MTRKRKASNSGGQQGVFKRVRVQITPVESKDAKARLKAALDVIRRAAAREKKEIPDDEEEV
jgi:hypothetical protein